MFQLINRWRVLLTCMQLAPENASAVTYATCVLHNMLSIMRPKDYLSVVAQQTDVDGTDLRWRDLETLAGLQRTRGQRSRQEAVNIRDHIRSYYNGVGAVPWQDRAVLGHVSTNCLLSNALVIILIKFSCITYRAIYSN